MIVRWNGESKTLDVNELIANVDGSNYQFTKEHNIISSIESESVRSVCCLHFQRIKLSKLLSSEEGMAIRLNHPQSGIVGYFYVDTGIGQVGAKRQILKPKRMKDNHVSQSQFQFCDDKWDFRNLICKPNFPNTVYLSAADLPDIADVRKEERTHFHPTRVTWTVSCCSLCCHLPIVGR